MLGAGSAEHAPKSVAWLYRMCEAGAMANSPDGFEFRQIGSEVVISHHGRRAATLRGTAALRFLAAVENGDRQQLMARVTGNYKHGNERANKNRPPRQQR